MKGFFKKFTTVFLAGAIAFSAGMLAACKPKNNELEEAKKTKTILDVTMFLGGLGRDWLDQTKKEFEEMLKDVSFEEGKKGVYVNISANKSYLDIAEKLEAGTITGDVFYTAEGNLEEFTRNNTVLNVTDIVTEKVYDEAGNVKLSADKKSFETNTFSLVERMQDYHRVAFNTGTQEVPEYFAIPYEDSLVGFVVDWDMVTDPDELNWTKGTGYKGMPGTYEEFIDLLDTIKLSNASPFTYGSNIGWYSEPIQRAVIAKVEGTQAYYDLFTDYTGEYAGEKIEPSSAYKLLDTEGYKMAVQMGIDLYSADSDGNFYYDSGVANGVNNTEAQQDFILSKNMPVPRIAMLLEGDWWENEARATFESEGQFNEADGYGKRNFRLMPIPDMTEHDKNEKYTVSGFSSGYLTVVNANVKENPVKENLVKLWLQYQYSLKPLKTFTICSGSVLPFRYEMSDEDLEKLTPFARDIWELRRSDEIEIVYDSPMKKSSEVRNASISLKFNTTINKMDYTSVLFYNCQTLLAKNKLTVEDYIAGMHAYYDQKIKDAFAG